MTDKEFMAMVYGLMAAHNAESAVSQAKVEHYLGAQGQMFDRVAAPGTPGTVTMPLTGHVLSLPDTEHTALNVRTGKQEPVEGFMGYGLRVAVQCGWDETHAIAINPSLILAQGTVYTKDGAAHNDWPTIVDCFYNRDAYYPVSAADKAKAAAEWAAANANVAAQAASPFPPPPGTQQPGEVAL